MSVQTDQPLAAAHRVTNRDQAERLKGRLEDRAAQGTDGPDWFGEADQAVAHLNEHHLKPKPKATPAARPPAPAPARRPGRRPTPTTTRPPSTRDASPRSARSSAPDRAARRVARSSSRFGRRLLAPTTAAAGTAGQLAMKVLGWGLGLSLLYLLLTKGTEGAAGQSGVEKLFGGVTGAVTGLVSASADPLSPKTWAAQPAPAAAPAPAPAPAAKPRPTVRARTPARLPVGAH